MTLFGIDRLLADPDLRKPLEGRRVALLAHPASVTKDLSHSLDALVAAGVNIAAVFGPQHGVRGDLQDNMMESPDFTDPKYGVPVFSLYGEVRRPTGQSMGTFDTILIDLQDVGCRIYTFITTLLYVLEACAEHGKSVWLLDRPNPAGRPIEGLALRPGWESFVGAGPIPMRHGLTLGELGRWFVNHFQLDVDYRVIEMEGWRPEEAPGPGAPESGAPGSIPRGAGAPRRRAAWNSASAWPTPRRPARRRRRRAGAGRGRWPIPRAADRPAAPRGCCRRSPCLSAGTGSHCRDHFFVVPEVSVTRPRLSMPIRLSRSSVSITVP